MKLRRILTKHKRTLRSSTFIEKIKNLSQNEPIKEQKSPRRTTALSPKKTLLAQKTFANQLDLQAHKRVLGLLIDEYKGKIQSVSSSLQSITHKRRLELLRYDQRI